MPLVLELGEKIDCSCVCWIDSVFLLALLFLVLMCIYSIAQSESQLLEFLQRVGKMGEGEMEDDRAMIKEDKFVVHIQTLGGSLVLIFIRTGILVCLVAVVEVRVVSFGERSLSMTDVECLEVDFRLVGDGMFDLGGDFMVVLVEEDVEHLELGMEDAVWLVWGCLSWRMYFLWRLSLMSVDLSSVW